LTAVSGAGSLRVMIAPRQRLDVRFRLKIVRAGAVEEVEFAQLLTRRTIVSVYMKNNTPSCDRQNDALASVAAELDQAGFNLIALSRDTCGSHRRYAAGRRINYILASDPGDNFARAADSLVPKSMYGRSFVGPARAAFVLDRDGTVMAVAEKIDAANHAAQLRALVESL
jgi:thioredoxin-dependent peroxiredoxin